MKKADQPLRPLLIRNDKKAKGVFLIFLFGSKCPFQFIMILTFLIFSFFRVQDGDINIAVLYVGIKNIQRPWRRSSHIDAIFIILSHVARTKKADPLFLHLRVSVPYGAAQVGADRGHDEQSVIFFVFVDIHKSFQFLFGPTVFYFDFVRNLFWKFSLFKLA